MNHPEWKLDENQERILHETCRAHGVDPQLIIELMTVELACRTRGSMWGVLNELERVFNRALAVEEGA